MFVCLLTWLIARQAWVDRIEGGWGGGGGIEGGCGGWRVWNRGWLWRVAMEGDGCGIEGGYGGWRVWDRGWVWRVAGGG